ncbi:putative inner membrane protein DUF1819 [Melghirimyces profundicolus]|uniref:Putative inner membrane protein DUF1819 n=1 Tax=Melghirimyces profundicolus TaxID=1242148 RepID=A0A2T6B9E0_9BACL|nr:DUF1819 family protein [Melghirimyces profundicolus]PTX52701.1 putative inner membrane protein DUF1819 [Melghirimyces profundicolus]
MSQDYSAGFISGSEHLYRYEIKQVLLLLDQGLTQKQIREKALRENLFRQKSHQANVVLLRKVFKRVDQWDKRLREFVQKGTSADVNAILLYAYLKCYRFLREFAYEVVVYLHEQGQRRVTRSDIVDFFERKEEQSPKIRNFTPETKQKMRQVMLKAYVEAECLIPGDTDWEIRPIPISEELKAYVREHPEHRMLAEISLTGGW